MVNTVDYRWVRGLLYCPNVIDGREIWHDWKITTSAFATDGPGLEGQLRAIQALLAADWLTRPLAAGAPAAQPDRS